MVCRTCSKSTKAKSSRPASPAVVLDFNEVVAADIIWLDTVDATRHPALNIVDVASTYQVVLPLSNTTSEEVGRAMVEGWMSWAGAPKHLIVDLDSAFKDNFLQVMNERAVIVRCAAGQAHWQNGVAERHGGAWKEIWNKLAEDHTILSFEMPEAMAATSDAKNQLRNRSGFSPRQCVFGCNIRMPGDLFDGSEELAKMGRRNQIRMAAKAAFFQCQTKSAPERAMHHKTRVEEKPYEPGELVYAYREFKGKQRWLGPCSVIGREGQNYWLARGGRCLLCAPEHLWPAQHEEVSEGLRLKLAMRELKELMKNEVEWHAVGDGDPGGQHVEMEVEDAINPVEARARAIQSAARKAHVLDDVPVSIKRSRVHHLFMTGKAISVRGQEKQLENELPWNAIPFEERELYIAAEEKQWNEHVQFEAVRTLSVEESQKVIETVDPKRILNSRFLYKDKNHAKRKLDKQVPPKPKARLCVAGQWDPDLGHVEMSTDAPTVSRHAIILALQ